MSDPYNPSYDYIVYIDEAGDTGTARVRPDDPTGSSEWFILSGVIIPAEVESEIPKWLSDLRYLTRTKRKDIHFAKLHEPQKLLAASYLSSLRLRAFVVASNKKNMKQFRNERAEKMGNRDWFYSYVCRILMERVTHFVAEQSTKKFGSPRFVKLEFSERGGLRVPQVAAYFEILRAQTRAGTLVNPRGTLAWDTINPLLFETHQHNAREGLQLSDIVATAFFKACDAQNTGGIDTRFAQALSQKIGRTPNKLIGRAAGYGVKLLPSWSKAKLTPQQEHVFRFYGYPDEWRAPVPSPQEAF